MKKKNYIISLFTIIILFMCSGFVFAEDGNSSINLGNEIMQSVDKTGDSFNNMISGNTIRDAGNSMKNGINSMMNGTENMVNKVENGVNNIGNMNMAGDYNVVRTDVEGTTNNFSTMTTTTWMWVILVVAAIVIIAAIWYYATQDNG